MTRRLQAEREASLTPDERVAKMESTTAFAVELLMSVTGIDREEAIRRLRDAGAVGRNESECSKRRTSP